MPMKAFCRSITYTVDEETQEVTADIDAFRISFIMYYSCRLGIDYTMTNLVSRFWNLAQNYYYYQDRINSVEGITDSLRSQYLKQYNDALVSFNAEYNNSRVKDKFDAIFGNSNGGMNLIETFKTQPKEEKN